MKYVITLAYEIFRDLIPFVGSLQYAGITITDLEPNIEYILGLMIYNGIITHSSQHTIRIHIHV